MRSRHCWLSGIAIAFMAALAQCSSPPPSASTSPPVVLKVIMEPTPTNYRLVNEVLQAAANVKVEFVPTPAADLIAALNAGRGDVVANLIVPPDREEPAVDLVPFVTGVREVVATGPNEKRLVSLEDLEGRSIHVAKNGRHFASLQRLNQQLAKINKPGCTIVETSESLKDEDLLQMVDAGKIPATIVDSHVASAWRTTYPKISINDDIAVSQDIIVAWATRRDSSVLRDRIRALFRQNP